MFTTITFGWLESLSIARLRIAADGDSVRSSNKYEWYWLNKNAVFLKTRQNMKWDLQCGHEQMSLNIVTDLVVLQNLVSEVFKAHLGAFNEVSRKVCVKGSLFFIELALKLLSAQTSIICLNEVNVDFQIRAHRCVVFDDFVELN